MIKKYLSKITNGVILIILALLHTQLAFSDDGFGKQMEQFSTTNYYSISGGMEELPAIAGKTNFENFAAFWFFYFGLVIIPLGLLVHFIERKNEYLPFSFTISYLIFLLIGSYMVPNSGMTFIMLPHAIFMLFINYRKYKKSVVIN